MIERLQVRVQAGAVGEFSSSELTFCADSYSVSILPNVTTWHAKDPSRSAKSAGGTLHLNTHTPLTQQSQSGRQCCPCIVWEPSQKKELKCNLSENTWPQSSQPIQPLWTYPAGLKSGTGVPKLTLTLKKKKIMWGINHQTFPQNVCLRGWAPLIVCGHQQYEMNSDNPWQRLFSPEQQPLLITTESKQPFLSDALAA